MIRSLVESSRIASVPAGGTRPAEGHVLVGTSWF